MICSTQNFRRLGGFAAAAFLSFPCAAMLHAQQGESFETGTRPTLSQSAVTAPRTLNLDLQAALHAPLNLSDPGESSSSSSSDVSAPTAGLDVLPGEPGGGMMQPPPRRRRYGRPNYNDRFHNSDGSNRLAFVVGGGFNEPVGSASSDYLGLNYRFQVGGGINFSQKFGILAQFDYDRFSVPGNILRGQQALYSKVDPVDDFTGLDGNAHIWSFTLNPTFNLHQGDSWGTYVTAGGGFYHKVTNFTVPSVQQYCDFYGFCYQYQANQIIDHYFSNSPGVTGGVGATYKFSRFANQRFFGEVRYVHTFNSARAGDPTYTGAANGQVGNLYPPNSNETSYIPVTFGIRF